MPSRRMLIRGLKYLASFGQPGPDLTWVTDLLAVSGSLHPRHVAQLANIGVKAIVDLRAEEMDDPKLMARHGIRFLHLPVQDLSAPTQRQLEEGTQWVLNELHAGRKALVHCKAGAGRSVVLACCVLMAEGYDVDEALDLVKSKRWGVVLNARQMDSLNVFHARLSERSAFSSPQPDRPRRHNPRQD